MLPRLEIISSNGGGILTTFQSKSSNPFRQMMLLHFLPLSGDPLACKYDGWTDKGNAVATDGRRMWECFCDCNAASMGELRSKRKKGGGNSPVSCVFALILPREGERERTLLCPSLGRGRERDPFKVATSSITHAAVVVISPLLPHSFPF